MTTPAAQHAASILIGSAEDKAFDLHSDSAQQAREAFVQTRRQRAIQRAMKAWNTPEMDLDAVTDGDGWRVWRPTDSAWPATFGTERCSDGYLQYENGRAKQLMCLAENDFVSNGIRRHSRWRDCERLSHVWQALDARVNGSSQRDEPRGIFLDVGANIGACTVEMLLSTRAHVVAFEPSPINLFYLTRSLRLVAQHHPELASRVLVFPLALGRGSDNLLDPHVSLFAERGNLGNTVVGTAATADGRCWSHVHGRRGPGGAARTTARRLACSQQMRQLHSRVPSARLDDLFPRGLGMTRLVKLDVQGHECNVLEGARATMAASSHLSAITTEVSSGLLGANCCGRRWLLHLLHVRGPQWTVSCTRRERRAGGEATCVARAVGSNLTGLPTSVLGRFGRADERRPLSLEGVEAIWRACTKHSAIDLGCRCDVYPRVARGLA